MTDEQADADARAIARTWNESADLRPNGYSRGVLIAPVEIRANRLLRGILSL